VGINIVGRPVDGIDAGVAGEDEAGKYELFTDLTLTLEITFGVGVIDTEVTVAELLFLPMFFKLIFPVTTAKKTITTTNPKTKEIILFKPSIYPILYHKVGDFQLLTRLF
jgi:hypothetical protein